MATQYQWVSPSYPRSQCGDLSTTCAEAWVYDLASCAFQIVCGNEANILCFQGTLCTKSQEQGLSLDLPGTDEPRGSTLPQAASNLLDIRIKSFPLTMSTPSSLQVLPPSPTP